MLRILHFSRSFNVIYTARFNLNYRLYLCKTKWRDVMYHANYVDKRKISSVTFIVSRSWDMILQKILTMASVLIPPYNVNPSRARFFFRSGGSGEPIALLRKSEIRPYEHVLVLIVAFLTPIKLVPHVQIKLPRCR